MHTCRMLIGLHSTAINYPGMVDGGYAFDILLLDICCLVRTLMDRLRKWRQLVSVMEKVISFDLRLFHDSMGRSMISYSMSVYLHEIESLWLFSLWFHALACLSATSMNLPLVGSDWSALPCWIMALISSTLCSFVVNSVTQAGRELLFIYAKVFLLTDVLYEIGAFFSLDSICTQKQLLKIAYGFMMFYGRSLTITCSSYLAICLTKLVFDYHALISMLFPSDVFPAYVSSLLSQ